MRQKSFGTRIKGLAILTTCFLLSQCVSDLCRPNNMTPRYCNCTSVNDEIKLTCDSIGSDKFYTDLSQFEGIKINILIIRSIHFTTLRSNAFKGLLIETISFEDSSFKGISDDSFNGLENTLKKLSIVEPRYSDSDLKWVPSAAIKKLKMLNYLYLGLDSVETLRNNEFMGLDNLINLTVMSFKLQNIELYTFKGLKKLKYLKLDSYKSYSLNKDILFGLNELEFIYISAPGMKFIEEDLLSPLKNIKQVHIQFCTIATFPRLLFQYQPHHIMEISLNYNRATKIDGLFDNLKNLTYLDLHANDIGKISATSFKGLNNLKKLSLSSNELTYVAQDAFSDLESLEELGMDYNYIPKVLTDKVFHKLKNLTRLSLKKFGLTLLPINILKFNDKLQYLDLSYNSLKSLDSTLFSSLKKLDFLDLSNNNLNNIATNFSNVSMVSKLYLDKNALTTLNPKFFEPFQKLQYLSLAGNPWNCDCKMLEFIKNYALWREKVTDFQDQVVLDLDLRMSICASPSFMAGKTLLDFDEMTCENITSKIAATAHDLNKLNTTLTELHINHREELSTKVSFIYSLAIIGIVVAVFSLLALCCLIVLRNPTIERLFSYKNLEEGRSAPISLTKINVLASRKVDGKELIN